jgi:hypothetical protein
MVTSPTCESQSLLIYMKMPITSGYKKTFILDNQL